jgi:hypothetical protein
VVKLKTAPSIELVRGSEPIESALQDILGRREAGYNYLDYGSGHALRVVLFQIAP